ncbi:MAG: hypothetical protein M9894_08595 [Planctomycetes bacterium]|nr:hypothetical protein [Planctomycetota bacterium]
MNGRTLTTLVAAAMATGVVAAGCSTGGGGGGKASTGPGITPVQSGSLVEGLPAPQLDQNGYDFSAVQVNQVPGGTVGALAAAPINTAVFAGNFPGGSVLVVDDTSVTLSGSLFYEARSMAADGPSVFAATGNPQRDGAGDLYTRDATTGAWSVAIDTQDAEMVVGAGLLGVHAAHGGARREGTLRRLNGSQWSSIASLQSAIPTALCESDGRLFVGGSDAFGGHARLLRLDPGATTLADVPLPGVGGFGVRQEVTSMVSIATVASGSIVPVVSEVLIVAVASIDATGAGAGGAVFATDGRQRVEVIATYAGDAPRAVLFQDSALVVITMHGKIFHRDAQGNMVEETIPVGLGVTRLDSALSRDQASVVLGGRTATGAVLVRRVARGGGYVPPVGDLFYRPDVRAILQARCTSCHVAPNNPQAVTALEMNFSDDQATFNRLQTRVNTGNPAQSLLITKATGTSHGGGTAVAMGSNEYNSLVEWVRQGARYEQAAAALTYVAQVRNILMDCSSCHVPNHNSQFRLSNNLSLNMQDYQTVLGFINTATPETSQLLRKATNNGGHGGGQRFSAGSPSYNTLVQWIQQGTQFQ